MIPRWAISAAAVASVALMTLGTWHLGLHSDDYFMVRPHSWAELRHVWHGTWDWGHVWPPYFRPLAVWANEATFLLTGDSAVALRLVVALELLAVAVLLGHFVGRELRSPLVGAFAAALITAHPAASLSMGWYFQQNHRWAAAATLVACLCWQRLRRAPSATAWWPIHAAVLIGALFKEEVLAVEPMLLLWQWMRARWIGDVPRPSVRMAVALGVGCGVFLWVRSFLLGGFGGELDELGPLAGLPYRIVWSMYSGLLRFRDLHANTSPVLWLASASTAALWILGGVVVWRRRSHATLLVAQGLTLAVASASLASVAVPWYTRHHLIAIGGVLIASALLAGVLEYAALRRRAIAAAIALTLIVTSLLASRSMLLAYGPCDPHTLDEDRHVATWIGPSPVPEFQWVPPWLDRKALLCASPADHDDAAAVRRGEIIR